MFVCCCNHFKKEGKSALTLTQPTFHGFVRPCIFLQNHIRLFIGPTVFILLNWSVAQRFLFRTSNPPSYRSIEARIIVQCRYSTLSHFPQKRCNFSAPLFLHLLFLGNRAARCRNTKAIECGNNPHSLMFQTGTSGHRGVDCRSLAARGRENQPSASAQFTTEGAVVIA